MSDKEINEKGFYNNATKLYTYIIIECDFTETENLVLNVLECVSFGSNVANDSSGIISIFGKLLMWRDGLICFFVELFCIFL